MGRAAGLVDEREEANLEFAAGNGHAVLQNRSDHCCATPVRVAAYQVRQGKGISEPSHLGFVDGAFDLRPPKHRGEIEERARDRVTGMPRSMVISSSGRGSVWIRIRRRGRLDRSTVTSSAVGWRRPQWAAAARWLSTAPGPAASTAAIRTPSGVSSVWPTAYTPRCTMCKRLWRSLCLIASRVTPACTRFRLDTMPCWRPASSAITASTPLPRVWGSRAPLTAGDSATGRTFPLSAVVGARNVPSL